MKFVPPERGSLVRRTEIADTLTALAPDDAPSTDFQRGYVAALYRVGLVFGVTMVEQPSTIVEVTP